MDDLNALSPLDGRYAELTAPLNDYFSEFAFLRDRVRIELDYVTALSKIGVFRALTDSESAQLALIKSSFSLSDAESIHARERETRHDVKAIEYFLQEKFHSSSLKDFIPWIHFGLTSEDANNIAQAAALQDSRNKVILPALDSLLSALRDFAIRYRALPMLARTHGQFAVPTTLGKEFAVYFARLKKTRDEIALHRFEAKLTGAVGNFNALQSAAPQMDWFSFSKDFITGLGLEANLLTTQILPYDNWLRYFDTLRLTNSILLDFAQDAWHYISDDYLRQAVVEGEVGSSTMPQKVNPIDFENAEGNLGVANSLFTHYTQKLPISRLQRDLSDSTVRRTFGTAIGHMLVAWVNLTRGMNRIAPNKEKIKADLDAHWEVISEGAQTILRAAGHSDAYESLKRQARGRVMTQADYKAWVEAIEVDEETRSRLRGLLPESYIGLAVQLVEQVTADFHPA
ncbi:MAG TPA: adenylosuccinate lyase [Anaerolineales bacterium]|nr:adenylosuccinate lyase [Anaerolineales bacterium]